MPDSLRLGFAGTPAFAATILRGLLEGGYAVALVLTQPDRPAGRDRKLKPGPVKVLAREHGLTIREPAGLRGISLREDHLDLLIVAAYGLILPAELLAEPRLGCLNVHASLLPRWRGAAPVERAIMAGDTETGVCLMQMDEGLDTGPVYACETLCIGPAETGGALEARLAAAGAGLLLEILPSLPGRTPRPQPDTGITYAHKITPADSMLDWTESAASIACRIRALTDRQPVTVYATDPDGGPPIRVRLLGAQPIPASESTAGTGLPGPAAPGSILQVSHAGLEIGCATGSVLVERVALNRGQGRPMTPLAATNGFPELIRPGRRLSSRPES